MFARFQTTRASVIGAIFFAIAVLLAPAWHATQASQPADCCDQTSQITAVTVNLAQFGPADVTCCCVPVKKQIPQDQPPAEDAPTPDPQCPSDDQCPCCNYVVASTAAPLTLPIASSINESSVSRVIATSSRPDSRVVAIDARPPIA